MPRQAGRWWGRAMTLVLLWSMLVFIPAPTASAEPDELCTSVPFSSNKRHRYRLPSIVATKDGRVFAFAERRNGTSADVGHFDVAMRVSLDGGCTWEGDAPVAISDWGSSRVSNPVAIYDEERDRILLFTTVTQGRPRLYLQEILLTDNGYLVPELAYGQVQFPGYRSGLTGPGHGLVLTRGEHAGRIIFAMGYSRGATRWTRGIYSDDGGLTWQVGYDRPSGSGVQPIEGTIAELPDGRLLISYRDNKNGNPTPGRNRISAISSDQGETVGQYSAMRGVRTVPVQGSLLQVEGNGQPLLFSGPSTVGGNLNSRRGMRIWVSTNNGESWQQGLAIGGSRESAAYSDLVQLDEDRVGILYENGFRQGFWDRIIYKQVAVSAIVATVPKSTLSRTSDPSISGTIGVGRVVTAVGGDWYPEATTVEYQWLRNGEPIEGADSSSYHLTAADLDAELTVKMTASRAWYRTAVVTASIRTTS